MKFIMEVKYHINFNYHGVKWGDNDGPPYTCMHWNDMLKVISAFEWFRCVQNCSSYQKERIALLKCLTFLLEREREREPDVSALL